MPVDRPWPMAVAVMSLVIIVTSLFALHRSSKLQVSYGTNAPLLMGYVFEQYRLSYIGLFHLSEGGDTCVRANFYRTSLRRLMPSRTLLLRIKNVGTAICPLLETNDQRAQPLVCGC